MTVLAPAPALTPHERAAVRRLLQPVDAARSPAVRAAFLFGSKARGDFDADSDIDLLLLCSGGEEPADEIGRRLAAAAERIEAETGVAIEPWAVSLACLERGRRTPMLVDALDDGVPLWPPDQPPVRVPFTPPDARFCAGCLLDWVAEGGLIAHAALAEGRCADAAGRARDDITRLATACLLLTGSTRHRRTSALVLFERRFVRTRRISPAVLPALRWAYRAFPVDDGRGRSRPPVTVDATARAATGLELASVMASETVPWILDRLDALAAGDADGLSSGGATPPSIPPR